MDIRAIEFILRHLSPYKPFQTVNLCVGIHDTTFITTKVWFIASYKSLYLCYSLYFPPIRNCISRLPDHVLITLFTRRELVSIVITKKLQLYVAADALWKRVDKFYCFFKQTAVVWMTSLLLSHVFYRQTRVAAGL